jgi:hypothetical protein
MDERKLCEQKSNCTRVSFDYAQDKLATAAQ